MSNDTTVSTSGFPGALTSSILTGSVTCTCGKRFKTNKALEQHERDSPVHRVVTVARLAGKIKCSCGKTVKDEVGLEHHVRDSLHHGRFVELGAGTPENNVEVPAIATTDDREHPTQGTTSEKQAVMKQVKKKLRNKIQNASHDSYRVWSSSGECYSDVGTNHALCDKDCGWCRHCADNADY